MPWVKINDNIIPDFTIGQIYNVSAVDVTVGRVIYLFQFLN